MNGVSAMQAPDGTWMAWGELGESKAQIEGYPNENDAVEAVAEMLVANENARMWAGMHDALCGEDVR